jgi:hypothetical protein
MPRLVSRFLQAYDDRESTMKYLCLAYGAEKDWVVLSKKEQEALLAQDQVLKARGDFVTAVELDVHTVRAWDGQPHVTAETFARPAVPLAGFAIIEAANLEEVIALVKDTPCARAGGAIEIRPFMQ